MWLIDWENAKLRQTAYDLFVMSLQSRSPAGLANRLQQLVQSAPPWLADSHWPGLDWSDNSRRWCHLRLFLLEELSWHVEENANPLFARTGFGLEQLLAEINQCPSPNR